MVIELTDGQKMLIESCCRMLEELCQRLKDIAEKFKKLYENFIWAEPATKYLFIRSLGNMQYCRTISRKTVCRARSCC